MADQTNWRQKQRTAQIAATDEVKAIYLCELEEHGRKFDAARAAGVSQMTMLRAMDRDTEFADAVQEALGVYSDKVKKRHQHLVFNDEVTEQLDAKGNVKSVNKRAYEKSVHKELEATAPGDYRPGHSVELTTKNSGVLVVGETPDLVAFAKEVDAANRESKPPTEDLDE